MSEESKRETGSLPQRPRSPRVPVNFTVELEGRTDGGEPFRTNSEAVLVSRGGATLITDAPVVVGTLLRLTPPFGRTLEAEVNGVWIDETDGLQRIGLKLLYQNGWFAE